MWDWPIWNVLSPGKAPLLVALLTFVAVFVLTRVVTRLIRAGRGRRLLRNAVVGGLHVHHAVLGIVLLVAGAVMGLLDLTLGMLCLAGFLVGSGASLVLDEFANILHLDDVYWRTEGRSSLQAVVLTVVCLVAVLVGFNPFGVDDLEQGGVAASIAVVGLVVVTIVAVIVCAFKGKYRFALIAVFIPFVALVGATRLARPDSPWARRYDAAKLARARRRADRFDAVTNPVWHRVGDVIAGAPTWEVSTRLAGPRDVEALQEIEISGDRRFAEVMDISAWPAPPTGAQRAAQPGFLIVAGQPVVGFAHVLDLGGRHHLEELAVTYAEQRQGVGGALVEGVCRELRRRGVREVTLRTFREVAWNAPFYARHGFTVLDTEPDWMAPMVRAEQAAGLAAAGPRVAMIRTLL